MACGIPCLLMHSTAHDGYYTGLISIAAPSNARTARDMYTEKEVHHATLLV